MISVEDWQTDRYGKLSLGGIHDGTLEAFGYASGSLTFAVRGVGGELTTFVASQVHVMCISELWEGTIVSQVRLWRGEVLTRRNDTVVAQAWVSLLHSRTSVAGLDAHIAAQIARHPESILLGVESSCGGDWSVLCAELAITQDRSCPKR